MPTQETFLDQIIDGKRVQVVKTYDGSYAEEVFGSMSDTAKFFLWTSLQPEQTYEPNGLPSGPGADYDAFLLDELLEQGREDWETFSYFVVTRGGGEPSFVSPDWPTAESFAKSGPVPPLPPRPSVHLDTSGPQS